MKHSITVKKTAHYYVQQPSLPVQKILLVIHGYAQLAEDFIQEFKELEMTSTLVIAPEALSKFYNKERKPVANWMTSHEREDEILDYINYLNQLTSRLQQQYVKASISVVGFSQGVSTLLRWVAQTNIAINQLHLCAGTIPPELSHSNFSRSRESLCFYYYGSRDKLLTPENARKQIHLLQNMQLHIKGISFDGRHEIPKQLIENLML